MIEVPAIGTRVRNTFQNFNGTVCSEPHSGRVHVKPDNKEVQVLYPYGIPSLISNLELITEEPT